VAAAEQSLIDYNEYPPNEPLRDAPPVKSKSKMFSAKLSTSGLST
jgi:hypothetical protein